MSPELKSMMRNAVRSQGHVRTSPAVLWERGRRRRVVQLIVAATTTSVLLVGVGVFFSAQKVGSDGDQLAGPARSDENCQWARFGRPSDSGVPGQALESGVEFRPPYRREGDNIVLPIAFTDGTRAEMVYPASLKLEKERIQPDGAVGFNNYPSGLRGAFTISFTGKTLGAPLELEPDGDRVWRPHATVTGSTLLLRLGCWQATQTASESINRKPTLKMIEDRLRAVESSNGFLMLRAERPLEVLDGRDFPTPAGLLFGDHVQLRPACTQLASGDRIELTTVAGTQVMISVKRHWAWCRNGIFVSADGTRRAKALVRSLIFRNVERQ